MSLVWFWMPMLEWTSGFAWCINRIAASPWPEIAHWPESVATGSCFWMETIRSTRVCCNGWAKA